MTLEEIRLIEEAAERGEQTSPATVLRLTVYLRNVLQMKTNAEALVALHRKENVKATEREASSTEPNAAALG